MYFMHICLYYINILCLSTQIHAHVHTHKHAHRYNHDSFTCANILRNVLLHALIHQYNYHIEAIAKYHITGNF